MRFDWYAATISADSGDVVRALVAGLGAEPVEARPLNGYQNAVKLVRDGSTVCRVLWGGNGGAPHAFATSDDAPAFAALVRSLWPDRHYVTRADVAADFDDGDTTWERLYASVLAVAQDRGLKKSQAGDWIDPDDGRTFYVGARKSAVFARLYEKGKQLRALATDGGADISLNLVRLELVARPDGEARRAAARMEPEEFYGFADWSKQLALDVFALDVDRVHIKERRESDDDRALFYAVKQYHDHFERLAERLGGWERVGPWIRAKREQMEQSWR